MRFGVVEEDSAGICPNVVLVTKTRVDTAIDCREAHLKLFKRKLHLHPCLQKTLPIPDRL